VTLTDSLGKCREKLDTCSQELSKLKSAVYSKEKLVSYIYYLYVFVKKLYESKYSVKIMIYINISIVFLNKI